MPRNSFLIEDILDKNDSSAKLGDQEVHPFKKRTFSAMNDSNESAAAATSRAKHFKQEPQCLSPASSVDSDLTSQASYYCSSSSSALCYDQAPNDLIFNNLLQNFQHSFNNDPQLLASYYAVLTQYQDDILLKRFKQQQASSTTPTDYNQQFNQYLMSKLLQQQQQPSLFTKHANNNNNNKTKPVKVIHNEARLLQKPKPNSMSSSPSSSSSSSSSAEMYSSNSNNLSPQSTSDDCSSSCIENVSPLDALLQLANSTFINKQNSQSDACLMDQEQSNNFKKLLQQNGAFIDESIFLNNELLLQQQQQQHQQNHQQNLEKQQQLNKSSLNNSFESNTSSTVNVVTTKPSILITSANANTKRKRKNRTAFTANQICELERRFANQKYLSPHDRDRIAYELQLSTAQVITWFQNRRAKQKRDIEEMKNDVNAAKSCKELDPDLDVEKVLRMHKYNEMNFSSPKLNSSTNAATRTTSATTSNSDRNSINENEFDPNEDDITNTDYDDDNQSINGSANGDSTSHEKSISEHIH